MELTPHSGPGKKRPSTRLPALAFAGAFALAAPGCRTSAPPAPPPAAAASSTSAPRPLGFPRLDDQVVYFAMIDRFADGDGVALEGTDPSNPLAYFGGDLRGLRARLPYLEDLGVTALWITPVYDQVDAPVGDDRPFFGYHGYWAEDLAAVDPHFGDEEDLRALVDEAHARSIRVVLDVVVNHVGYGARLARDPAWVRSPELGNCPDDEDATEIDRCLFGLPDLKTEVPEVREQVLGWALSWVERFPLDGFRIDTLKHVEPEMLAELHTRAEALAKERHGVPAFLALGEHWGASPGDDEIRALVEQGAIDTAFDFSFTGLAEGFLTGRMRAEALAHHLEARERAGGPLLATFLDNHDMTPLLHRLGEHAARYPLAAVLLFTTRGMPVVSWGNELGREGGEWPDNRRPMPWERLETDEGRRLHDVFRSLIHLRRAHPALARGPFSTLVARTDPETGDATLAFARGDPAGDDPVFLVVLRRGRGGEVPLPASLAAGRVVEECFSVSASPGRVALAGGSGADKGALVATLPGDAAGVWALSRSPGACRLPSAGDPCEGPAALEVGEL